MKSTSRNIAPIKTFQKDQKYSIILLYAGGNHKMKNGPRPLLLLNGKPLYEHHIKMIERRFAALDHTIVAVSGFEANMVMNKLPDNVIKVENENFETTNVSRSIGVGLRAASDAEHVIVIYGDLFFTHHAIDFPFGKSCIVIDKAGHMETSVGCSATDEKIDLMLYGMPYKWCEIAYFTGKELEHLKKICWDENKYRLFGFEVINEIIDRGGNFSIYGNERAKVCDLDSARHLLKARELIL